MHAQKFVKSINHIILSNMLIENTLMQKCSFTPLNKQNYTFMVGAFDMCDCIIVGSLIFTEEESISSAANSELRGLFSRIRTALESISSV